MRLIKTLYKNSKLPMVAYCAGFIWLQSSFATISAAETLNIFRPVESNSQYLDGLIKLALAESDTVYQFNQELLPSYMGRDLELLELGKLSVYWTATTMELEQTYRPIRIPLFRGLLGFRIFLIRKGEQHLFNHVRTIDDLRDISIGQGQDWTDTKILEANGLKVVKPIKYHSLFHMLHGGRFDAFPRGLQEPWSEMENHVELELEVEKRVLLSYKMPFYMFVAKGNENLARNLEIGMRRIIANGAFDQYFFNYPAIKDTIEKAGLKNRVVIKLNNPFLSPETPLSESELWLDLENL